MFLPGLAWKNLSRYRKRTIITASAIAFESPGSTSNALAPSRTMCGTPPTRVLTTGKPEALQIQVGTGQAPSIGPAGKRVSDVSLKAADLMQAPATQASPPNSQPPAADSRPPARPTARRATPEAPPVAAGQAAQTVEANTSDVATVQ
jgi:hypothetical protein